MAGRFLAYELEIYNRNDIEYEVRVLDTAAGRLLHRDSAISSEPEGPPGPGEHTGVQGLVVKANGSVAWLAGDAYSTATRFEVARHDKSGHGVLDIGGDFEPGSLRLSNRAVLSWRRGGVRKEARLR